MSSSIPSSQNNPKIRDRSSPKVMIQPPHRHNHWMIGQVEGQLDRRCSETKKKPSAPMLSHSQKQSRQQQELRRDVDYMEWVKHKCLLMDMIKRDQLRIEIETQEDRLISV